MKALFLISSIFYILGLKLGFKIDSFKSSGPVEKITHTTSAVKNAAKSVYFNDASKTLPKNDSVQNVKQLPEKEKMAEKRF